MGEFNLASIVKRITEKQKVKPPVRLGNRVRILRRDIPKEFIGKWGVVTDKNGAYFYVRPHGSRQELELYENEIERLEFYGGDRPFGGEE